MKIGQAFPSKYFKASDFESDTVLVMSHVTIETIGQGREAKESPILHFRDEEKALVLNKTNAGTITKLYGDDTDNWDGKPITLYATEVQFGNEMVMSVRVRLTKPAAKPQAAKVNPADTLAKLKSAALNLVKTKFDVDGPAAVEKVREVAGQFFPGQTTQQLGVAQWQQMIDAGMESDLSAVATAGGGVPDSEIPF